MAPVVLLLLIVGLIGVVTIVIIVKSALAPRKVAGIYDLYKQGKYAAVIKQTKQNLANDARNHEMHYLLGLAYLGDGKNELALMELKKVNEFGEFSGIVKEVEFRRTIAKLYNDFGQPEEALKEFVLLIRMQPEEPEWYFMSGTLFEQRGKTDSAVKNYKKND